jgi:N-ethylmaleimide reductase
MTSTAAEEIGERRSGIVISPGNPFNDIVEEDVDGLYRALVRALSPLGLAYLNVVHGGDENLIQKFRREWPTALLLNRRGADIETRVKDLDDGLADVITVGAQTLANPDLVARVKVDAPLNEADPSTFYGGGERGYTDYRALDSALHEG